MFSQTKFSDPKVWNSFFRFFIFRKHWPESSLVILDWACCRLWCEGQQHQQHQQSLFQAFAQTSSSHCFENNKPNLTKTTKHSFVTNSCVFADMCVNVCVYACVDMCEHAFKLAAAIWAKKLSVFFPRFNTFFTRCVLLNPLCFYKHFNDNFDFFVPPLFTFFSLTFFSWFQGPI